MKIKSVIVDDEKHGRENLGGRQTFRNLLRNMHYLLAKILNINTMKKSLVIILILITGFLLNAQPEFTLKKIADKLNPNSAIEK